MLEQRVRGEHRVVGLHHGRRHLIVVVMVGMAVVWLGKEGLIT